MLKYCTVFVIFCFSICLSRKLEIENAELLSAYNTPDYAYGVAVDIITQVAFIADYHSLQIINVSNPLSPTYISNITSPGNARAVILKNAQIACIADYLMGLSIINITNPFSPNSLSFFDTPGYAYGLDIASDMVYLADYFSGLEIINVANPSNPILVGNYDTPGEARKIIVRNNIAYIADRYTLQIIDVSSPSNPTYISNYSNGDSFYGIDMVDNLIYLIGTDGLRIIDVNNPAIPTLDGPGLSVLGGYWIKVIHNIAFISTSKKILLIDVSDPFLPNVVWEFDCPAIPYDIFVELNEGTSSALMVYVADYTKGLLIWRVTLSAASSLVVSYSVLILVLLNVLIDILA